MSSRVDHRELRLFVTRCAGIVFACLVVLLFGSSAAAEDLTASNFLFFMQLERTNPAMMKAMTEKAHVQEEHLIVNGRLTIPYLRDFKGVFTNSIEFRHYSPEASGSHLWNCQIGLYNRYLLRMQVPFAVDATWTNVLSFQAPKFYFMEWREPGLGRFGFYPVSSFGVSEWRKLVEQRGDLSALGIKPQTNAAVREFEFQWKNYHR